MHLWRTVSIIYPDTKHTGNLSGTRIVFEVNWNERLLLLHATGFDLPPKSRQPIVFIVCWLLILTVNAVKFEWNYIRILLALCRLQNVMVKIKQTLAPKIYLGSHLIWISKQRPINLVRVSRRLLTVSHSSHVMRCFFYVSTNLI